LGHTFQSNLFCFWIMHKAVVILIRHPAPPPLPSILKTSDTLHQVPNACVRKTIPVMTDNLFASFPQGVATYSGQTGAKWMVAENYYGHSMNIFIQNHAN
jgi:hypothetical protein